MSYNPFTLEGKTILVTGASSGIGKATAIECSKMGAKLIITGRNEERLNETLTELDGEGHIQIVADLADEEGLKKVVSECPTLDGLVNNAGMNYMAPVWFYTKEKIEKTFDINFLSPILLVKELVKKKKFNKGASIVFTSSIGQYLPVNGNGIYGCSKAGVETYTKFAAIELAPKGVRCNSIHPGMTHTPLIHGAISEEQLQEDMKCYPLQRYGDPKDIAMGMIYLLSDASSWVTGHSLVIDGGRTLR